MATAQELMEQNQELSQAVDGLAEATLEEQVLAKLKEIEAILTKLDSESIDLSVFLDQIQSFSDEKKAELQALVDKLDNPLGEKTITMKTIDDCVIIPYGYIFQEVWEKDGVITKYGDVFIAGYNNGGFNGGSQYQGAGFVRQPLPQDVEFDYISGSTGTLYARPKAGQSNVGGISGSLDNYIFMWGGGQFGTFGKGTTSNSYIPQFHQFPSRVSKIQAGVITRVYNGCYQNTLALLENGDVWCCGSNWQSGLGLGNSTQTNTWTKNNTIQGIKDIYMCRALVFAVGASSLYSWGENVYGSCGNGGSGTISSPRLAKSISSSAKVRFSVNGAYGGDEDEYVNSAVCIDGKLFGAGFNRYGEVNVDGANKNTLTEILDPQSTQWTLKDTDSFFMHMELGAVLKENSDGNMDLYVAGYGRYGYGDSTAAGGYTKKGYKKIKTFDGNKWKLSYQRQYTDNVTYAVRLFVVNEEKREIWAFGQNETGGLGIGSSGDANSRVIQKVLMPQAAKRAKRFEVRPQYCNTIGSLCVIIDNDFYACGRVDSYYRLKSGTSNILQKQN